MGQTTHTEPKQYLSITEAAEFLGVSRPTIYARLYSGELPYNQVSSRTIRIPLLALTSIQTTTHPTKKNQHLTAHDLRNYITREEVLQSYNIEKSKFHKVLQSNGIKAVRHGQKALYLKTQMHDLFYKETFPDVKEWYTSEELSIREGISRKHICATAHKLGIPVKRAGTVCYISKTGWDDRKLSPSILEKDYMTVDQAKKYYHIGGKTFYDTVNANNLSKVRKGNYVYFSIKDLDRLFKDKTPHIPPEIKRNYIRGCDALKLYHIGQKRFTEETRTAGIEKIRTEGNFVWYRKDQLDKLFKTLI